MGARPVRSNVWPKVIIIVVIIFLILSFGISVYAGNFFFNLVLTKDGQESIFKNIDVSEYDKDKGNFSIEDFKKEVTDANNWAQQNQTETWQIVS